MTTDTLLPMIVQAKEFATTLVRAGWTLTASHDLVSPSGTVWAQTTFTTGEYTLTCSRRPTGSGLPQGTMHVRVTYAKTTSHPEIGRELAQALIAFERIGGNEYEWPPAEWVEHARIT